LALLGAAQTGDWFGRWLMAAHDLTDHSVQGPPALLTLEQVAELLNVSVGYVRRRLIFEKRISYIKIGHKVRVEMAEIRRLIDRGRVTPGTYDGSSGVVVDGFQERLNAMPPRRR
jgi:excisionase family DNA binding protein